MSSLDLCSCSSTAAARYSLLTSLSSVGLIRDGGPPIYWRCTDNGDRVIALDLSMSEPDDIKSRDWSSFDAFSATLADVTKVILAISTKQDMTKFIQNVLEPQMPHIQTRLEVRYVIGKHKGWGGTGFVPVDAGPGASHVLHQRVRIDDDREL